MGAATSSRGDGSESAWTSSAARSETATTMAIGGVAAAAAAAVAVALRAEDGAGERTDPRTTDAAAAPTSDTDDDSPLTLRIQHPLCNVPGVYASQRTARHLPAHLSSSSVGMKDCSPPASLGTKPSARVMLALMDIWQSA